MPQSYLALAIGLLAAGSIAGLLVFFSARAAANRHLAEARAEAEAVLDDARRRAETHAEEIAVEAREAAARIASVAEEEASRHLSEAASAEQQAAEHEAAAARLESELEIALEEARRLSADTEASALKAKEDAEAAETARHEQIRLLEEVAGMTADQARADIVRRVEEEATEESARLVARITGRARQEANDNARRLAITALWRMSPREVLDPLASQVRLPNDDMKGRIIGREGRNIRTLELATGVDVIIDNTPGMILLSAYDPVRREIARISLEKLIEDGRIHPARIESVVERVRGEFEETVKSVGESAVFETGLTDVHPRLTRLLGLLRYRTHRGYNLLSQSVETALLAGYMAAETGYSEEICRRAGLMHAVAWAEDDPRGGSGAALSADLAGKYGESREIVHAIAALGPGVEPVTAEAVLVKIARRISESRPGARKDNVASFIERMKRLEEIAVSFDGVRAAYAVKGGKEMRVMVGSEDLSDEQTITLSRELARRIEKEVSFSGEIKVNVIRETRAVDYAV